MVKFLKKHKKIIIVICDVLFVPFLFCCHLLTDYMLTLPPSCSFVRFGGKCITCGGTHFVNYITSFRIAEAFEQNQFLFVLSIYFGISIIFLNLYLLFNNSFAKKALLKMYNIPVLIIILSVMGVFFIVRNIPMFTGMGKLIMHMLK
ncbi:MAG: DUF2752 domain-containing protein [Clostridia bacterium]|nr:DUF2752 domain-containing protein [Clostridia bacterium]